MQFASELLPGALVQRYKRFLADIRLDDGRLVTAHCPNSGAMTGLKAPGSRVWLSVSDNPKRRLAHTLELVEADGTMVAINTGRPNHIVAEAIEAGRIAALAGYPRLRREVPYGGHSRVDLLLEADNRPPAYVEVKNVHLRRPERHNGRAAEFPDAVTARGTKHLHALTAEVAAGRRAVMFFLVQRADCDHFRVADDIDPVYALALMEACAAGVETLCHRCHVDRSGVTLADPLPVRLPCGGQAVAQHP